MLMSVTDVNIININIASVFHTVGLNLHLHLQSNSQTLQSCHSFELKFKVEALNLYCGSQSYTPSLRP